MCRSAGGRGGESERRSQSILELGQVVVTYLLPGMCANVSGTDQTKRMMMTFAARQPILDLSFCCMRRNEGMNDSNRISYMDQCWVLALRIDE